MSALLHGQKINAFEQGYAAFIRGDSPEMNPFDGGACPNSRKRWGDGWDKAQREAWRRK